MTLHKGSQEFVKKSTFQGRQQKCHRIDKSKIKNQVQKTSQITRAGVHEKQNGGDKCNTHNNLATNIKDRLKYMDNKETMINRCAKTGMG